MEEKLNINEIIREEINNFINEELSISKEVVSTADHLFDIILNGGKKFRYIFFGVGEFTVETEITNVTSEKPFLNCSCNLKERVLTIQVPYYNNKILEVPLKEAIQHEVEHLFQESKKIGYKNPSFDKMYDEALKVFKDKNATSFDIKLARFIYCCSTKEQDAFINELYQSLYHNALNLNNNNSDIGVIRNSQIYKCKWIIAEMVNILKKELKYTTYNEYLKKYNKNKTWFITLGEASIKRIESKIRKVLAKSENDRLKNTLSPKVPLNVDDKWAEDSMFSN